MRRNIKRLFVFALLVAFVGLFSIPEAGAHGRKHHNSKSYKKGYKHGYKKARKDAMWHRKYDHRRYKHDRRHYHNRRDVVYRPQRVGIPLPPPPPLPPMPRRW